MANLTISVDDATLKRARMRALERNETVNGYLAEVLRRYAGEGPEGPTEAILEAARRSTASSGQGGRTWSREDAHRG
ncbi:MAG TPA: hypothetical protein GX743_07725 [Actinomycetales bacterium]|nr:hypothetical protein [Actinomycetales bacterium]